MFSKHLPPSAGLPRVLVLDEAAARELPPEVEPVREGEQADAVVGYAPPDDLPRWFERLRPGGRLILAHTAPAEALLGALTEAGFIHCLVEPNEATTLYRGERPPLDPSSQRLNSLISNSQLPAPFVFLLITQTPNKPAWKLAPDEVVEWRAATVIDPGTDAPVLLAFSSLVKAVAFMQKAVLAQTISGVNKVGKFRSEVAEGWAASLALPLLLNPDFDAVRAWRAGSPIPVDSRTAVTGDE